MSGTRAAFYCVADSRYFLGAVGMLNSLRLLGHREPMYVLDCGLTAEQRELLAPHATLVPAPSDTPPYLLKTVAPLQHPAEVTVLIDSDMIVTRSLTELIRTAANGRVVGFRNNSNRFFPQWGELLDLGPARPRPYVSVSLVFLGGELGAEVLRLVNDGQRRVDFDRTLYGPHDDTGYPFLYPEQDVLNAVIATWEDADPLVAVDERFEVVPPFTGIEVLDDQTLRCAFPDGAEPYVLHHFMSRKPWLHATEPGVYSQLLSRLLVAGDVEVKVPERMVPLRLRAGWSAALDRKRVQAQERLRWYVGKPLSARLRALRSGTSNRARAASG
jgi:hypothetical protein